MDVGVSGCGSNCVVDSLAVPRVISWLRVVTCTGHVLAVADGTLRFGLVVVVMGRKWN